MRSEAARAAQRAFFEAALGKTSAAAQPPVAQVQTTAPTVAVRPTSAIASLANAFSAKPSMQTGPATTAAPSRILRPGSIVDIKV